MSASPVVRPFSAEDVQGVVELLRETDAVDHAGATLTEAELREQLAWPFHDPGHDRWVAEDPGQPGRLVAHGVVWKLETTDRAELDLTVHPEWRRRGLGGALLSRLLERAAARGATVAALYPDLSSPAAAAFAVHHGFRPVALWTEMRAEGVAPASPEWPPGYDIRSYADVRSPELLAEVMTRSFEDQWGHSPVTAEMVAEWAESGVLRWDGIFLTFHGDAVAGVVRVEMSEERSERNGRPTGYVDSPGIMPSHRDAGLRLPLLLTGMRWLRDRGAEVYELDSWDDSEAALRLYEDVGFRVVRQGQLAIRGIPLAGTAR